MPGAQRPLDSSSIKRSMPSQMASVGRVMSFDSEAGLLHPGDEGGEWAPGAGICSLLNVFPHQ